MKLTAKRILKEDILKSTDKDIPAWFSTAIDAIIYIFNLFLEQVAQGLTQGLTFTENIQSQIREFTVTTASDYVAANTWTVVKFPWQFKTTKPVGVIPLSIVQTQAAGVAVNYTPLFTSSTLSWQYDGENVRITFMTGLADSCSYAVRVMVI